MRILQVCTRFPAGGIQRHVLDLTAWLRERGHKVFIAGSPGAWLDEQKDADFLPLDISAVAREGGSAPARLAAAARCARKLRAFLRANPVDLVHAHETAPAIVARLAVFGKATPLALTFHGAEPERIAQFSRIARATARQVITPSHASARDLDLAGGPSFERIRVIGLGVRHAPALPSVDVQDLRRSLLGDGAKLFVTIARLSHQKGIDTLVDVVRKVIAARSDVRFVVVGDGPQAEQARAWAEQAGVSRNILWAGRRDSPHLYLAAADAFLLPSRWESLPITIVEAFQHGLPVIATDTGGVRELVDDSVGRVASVGDAEALARYCLEIAGDDVLAGRLSSAAQERSREPRFDPAHMNGVMERLYLDIIAAHKPAQPRAEAR